MNTSPVLYNFELWSLVLFYLTSQNIKLLITWDLNCFLSYS